MAADGKVLKLDNQLCFALYSTVHALNRVYAPLLGDLGLTYPQYLVMLVLWEAEGLTVKAIGERLHLDSGTLTPLLKRLEAAKLIRRNRDPHDERLVRISLTAGGRALRRRALAIPQVVAGACGRPQTELTALRRDLVRLRETLIGDGA